jgi:Ser/Thr protein kinase RdoA (MazF antagonist)
VIAIDDLSPGVAAWAESKGYSNPERVSGGRNNRIFKLRGQSGSAALKVYYRGSQDRRDRFAAERSFYEIVAKRDVAAPQLLDCDQQLGVSLLSWIEGEPVGEPIGDKEIGAVAGFLAGVNEPVPAEEVPFTASEACFSTAEHFQLLEQRIAKLQNAASQAPVLTHFLDSNLAPFVARVRQSLATNSKAEFRSMDRRHIFSPGDFGLHNAMRGADGTIVFFDFEYSGWDDPVKTVADVFLQPEKPVEWKFLPSFCAQLHAWPGLEERVRLWLPFFAAKWAVILLGPAAKDAAQRRKFAGEEADEAMIERQVGKARIVIERGNGFLG